MEQKLNTEQLKLNILKSIALIFVGLLIVIVYIVVYAQQTSFQISIENHHKNIHSTIEHTIKHNTNHYANLLDRLANTSRIEKDLMEDNRDEVYKILKSKLDSFQRENSDFDILHFIKPDGKSYLRVHNKDQFGDDVSAFRLTIQNMIKNKQLISGYETGKHSAAFRVIAPIFYENKFIGSLGIGINPNYFIKKVSEIIQEDGFLFIKKENLKLFSKNSTFSIQDYMLQSNINKKSFDILKLLPKNYNFEDNTKVIDQEHTYIIHIHNIIGFDNKNYAKYLFIQDITQHIQRQNLIVSYLVLALLSFVFLIFLSVKFYLNRFDNKVGNVYKKIIKRIEHSKDYLKAVEDASPNIIISSVGKIIKTGNQAFLDFTNFESIDEFKKQYICICDLFVERKGYLEKLHNGEEWFDYMSKRPNQIHKAIMLKDGKEHIFIVNSNELNIDDHLRCMATFVDITELENLQERYETAINGTQDGLWDWNLITGDLYLTPQWKRQLGYEDDELINEFKTWEDHVHPEDKEKAKKDFTANIDGKTEIYENIHRLRHKNGSWVWILDRGKTTFDENGNAVRMVGFHTDITEQRKLEDKLSFNQNYLEKVFDIIPNILITTNGEDIDKANKAMFEFTDFKTLEDFKEKYNCICDLFLKGEGLVQAVMEDMTWLEYILSKPHVISKVSMKFQDKRHIFIVLAQSLEFDENHRSVITFVDITEIENLKDRYEFAISGSQDGLWDLNIVTNKPYFSPRWKSMLGYKENELKNEFKTWEDMVHPDDLTQVMKDIKKSHNAETEIYENIHRLKHKDGHWVWILTRGKTIFDDGKAIRMVGFHTDISKSKELESQLEENQKLYSDFFEYTKSANIIYTTKDDGKTFLIKNLNHLVENFENIEKKKVIGKRIDEVFEGVEEFGLLQIIKQVYISGEPYKMPITLYEDKKLTGWRENYIFKLSSGDIVASYEDRTKEKLLEESLREQEEIMIAQSRHAAMGEMISMIAHQWRQPLSVIAMGANNIMADIELEMVDNKSLQKCSIEIIEQTQELSKTIDDFRNFFRPMKITENILPEDIFNDAFKVIGQALKNNEIEVITHFNNGKKIQTYSRELMQVFINIIKNAKEVLVDKNIQKRRIIIYIENKIDTVVVKICDNGGGISNEIINKIFNPYFSTKDEKSGTGLGLYMSKTIVEKHLNGTLEAYNENDGACFQISLPYVVKQLRQRGINDKTSHI